MKSILVQIARDAGQEARLQVALDLTRAFDAHLTCLQTMPLEAFAATDPYGVSLLLAETIEVLREQEEAEREAVGAILENEGVRWDWRSENGEPSRALADLSWLADLVVVSLPEREWRARLETPPIAASVALAARAPVLAVPPGCASFDLTAPVVVGWNGSPEAATALRAALPLLARAQRVELVSVESSKGYDLPPTDAAEYLARHGITAEIAGMRPLGWPVTDLLIATAEELGASCVVMGAYGHSRMREAILGGVSRGMLAKSPVPLLLAH